jgi:hypothetical protein
VRSSTASASTCRPVACRHRASTAAADSRSGSAASSASRASSSASGSPGGAAASAEQFHGDRAQLLQPRRGRFAERQPADVGQRRAAPQRRRLDEQRPGLRGVEAAGSGRRATRTGARRRPDGRRSAGIRRGRWRRRRRRAPAAAAPRVPAARW